MTYPQQKHRKIQWKYRQYKAVEKKTKTQFAQYLTVQ